MVEAPTATKCPACGSALLEAGGSAGLCPGCLLELALEDTALEVELLVDPEEAPTLLFSAEGFSEGEIQGERYRIRALLGRGGMGEVWRAYDLKLRQEVALKALRPELIRDRDALETLRQEVRTAREVISPNVCRVFDLQELDGRELVSMEYIDGTTLQKLLEERSPLALDEAREIASQFLAGLEAIHGAGLVHRDVKPENVMVTRTGRVVVMDFGLAKGLGEGRGGVVAGTPAYMSPEQAKGGELDARADVFSAGVVLAEMVAPGGVHSFEERQQLWEAIHRETPQIAETPWSRVIGGCLARDPEARYATAAELARALEEVTLRAAGDETARPYPGLAAFEQEDAEYFYGRELEVEALWKKLRRPHLLAVIGPSGAGKSSFLRAGLLPTLTDGWRAVVTTPGDRPFERLAAALGPELGEAPGVAELLERFAEPEVAVELLSDWGGGHEHALLIVDQFEELFTQNSPEVQERFAELLGRLPLEADVFVLLSMRDDFLFHCHRFEAFQPILSDLTLLGPPTGASLRRALVQPALKCGYRFEEEAIVEEMLSAVEGQRGALPLLAFAAAQLWERRDRESGLVTQQAYEQIGGVGGALAQHAEAILDYIGEANEPIVRELFRNLVTAQGTRAARDREELLSVFEAKKTAGTEAGRFTSEVAAVDSASKRPGSVPAGAWEPSSPRAFQLSSPGSSAAEVLDSLIDARLLTSYEVPAAEEGGSPHHRIEIVHESLLSSWPRLVKWQRQDADSAQMRDELRHQARLWSEKGRPEDLLWIGSAFKEYQLWRERYPGSLSATEEEFARAMTAHAERRRRRRRVALAVVIAGLLVTLAIVTWSRFEAVAEARRAEAAKLLAIAQLQLETDPTEALAYTAASLELADTPEARALVMKALWAGPPALVVASGTDGQHMTPKFSRDGGWLSWASVGATTVLVWNEDGSGPIVLDGHSSSGWYPIRTDWISEHELVTGHPTEGRARIWSFPGGELRREIDFGSYAFWWAGAGHLVAEVLPAGASDDWVPYQLRSWRLPDGEAEDHGRVDLDALGASWSMGDPAGPGWFYAKGSQIFYRSFAAPEGVPDRLIGGHEKGIRGRWDLGEPGRLWTRDAGNGELRLWDLTAPGEEPLRIVAPPAGIEEGVELAPARDNRWLYDNERDRDGKALLWDLTSLPGANPRELKRSGSWLISELDFHPDGNWVAAATESGVTLSLWPLRVPLPAVVNGYDTRSLREVVFTPDSRWLATYWGQRGLRLWPLPGSGSRELRELELPGGSRARLSIDATGKRLFVAGYGRALWIAPLDGGEPRRLEGFLGTTWVTHGAFSPSGRLAAAATAFSPQEHKLVVWDLESGEVESLELPPPLSAAEGEGPDQWVWNLAFTDESTLLTAGNAGILRWDLESGTHEPVVAPEPGRYAYFRLSGDRRRMMTWVEGECGSLTLHNLVRNSSQKLRTFADCGDLDWPARVAVDPELSVLAVGRPDGTLRVGRLESESAHLLTGHEGPIAGLAISPDGRWVASAGEDKTLRLWQMPDLDQPPLHTLPLEELIAKLETLTNLRAVRDQASSTGWSIEIGPFPGWQEVPTW